MTGKAVIIVAWCRRRDGAERWRNAVIIDSFPKKGEPFAYIFSIMTSIVTEGALWDGTNIYDYLNNKRKLVTLL